MAVVDHVGYLASAQRTLGSSSSSDKSTKTRRTEAVRTLDDERIRLGLQTNGTVLFLRHDE